jgi:type IV pilus assembly protein PilA
MLQKMKKRIKNQRGMTLVELLAVIVILGIISAIAVPSIGGIIEKTKKDAKVAEAIQIINAAKLAHASNSNITHWKETADTAANPKIGGLSEYLSNVKDVDKDFEVEYDTTDKVYTITNHDACGIEDVGETPATTDTVTEAKLLEYSGN